MKNFSAKDLALELLHAEKESEVEAILRKYDLLQNPRYWRDLGDNPSNYSAIGNQQSEPDLALAEKITNSIDAVLLGEVKAKGINPESLEAPKSMAEAVKAFVFNKPQNVAERIAVTMTGAKQLPSVTIVDNGEGQAPADVPKTLLSLEASNKNRIPFVQGKFNMGGTGALRFAGEFGTQLIITRRQEELQGDKKEDGHWSVTVVRRFPPGPHERKSVYRYLAPIGVRSSAKPGSLLTFVADELPIAASESGPYARSAKSGTAIKLYEYDAHGFKGNALTDRGAFGRLSVILAGTLMPLSVFEHRDYPENGSRQKTIVGLKHTLDESHDVLMEKGFPIGAPLIIDGNKINVNIHAFKKEIEPPHKAEEGIIFLVNGQLHGKLPTSFFSSQVGYNYIEKSLFVTVDCSAVSTEFAEKLFLNNREKINFSSMAGDKLRQGLIDLLKSSPLLHELNIKRRDEILSKAVTSDQISKNLFKAVVKQLPWVSDFLSSGSIIEKLAEGILDTQNIPTYEGQFFPTYFSLKDRHGQSGRQRQVHPGQKINVYFETDAVNDYFTRADRNGQMEIQIEKGKKTIAVSNIDGPYLTNGVAHVALIIPEDLEMGRRGSDHTIKFTINDLSRSQPFVETLPIKVTTKENVPKRDEKDEAKPPKKNGGPTIRWITKDNWKDLGMNEESAVRVMTFQGQYEFLVNADNIHLQNELGKNSSIPTDVLKDIFKLSLVTLAIGAIRGARLKLSQDTEGLLSPRGQHGLFRPASDELMSKTVKYVSRQTDNAAPVILPIIRSLAAITFESMNFSKPHQPGDNWQNVIAMKGQRRPQPRVG